MASKTDVLWAALAEMFGAESLARKYGDTAPDTWVGAIGKLTDYQLERGMRRLVYGGKAHIPSLPEFLRMCRELGGDEFSAADAPIIPPSHQIERQPMQRWDREANDHLMGHITRRLASRSKLTVEPLVAAKNAWAQDMRDAESEGTLPTDNGKAWWDYAMVHAEKSADALT